MLEMLRLLSILKHEYDLNLTILKYPKCVWKFGIFPSYVYLID